MIDQSTFVDEGGRMVRREIILYADEDGGNVKIVDEERFRLGA